MKIKVLIILCTICYIFTVASIVIADSGFDFSYDSGSSSWDSSSSSWDYDNYSSGTSSYSSSSWIETILYFLIFGLGLTPAFLILHLYDKHSHKKTYDVNYKASKDKKITKLIPNFNKQDFLDNAYNIYVDLQKAWMNFKLDDVRNFLTNELYNMYKTQLETLKQKNQKNIMKDFNLININIIKFRKINKDFEIKVKLIVKQKDYIIDINTKKEVRGGSLLDYLVVYELDFIKKDINTKIELCPSCGAKIDLNTSTKCDNCGNILVSDDNISWVLSNKKIISQRISME